MKEFMAFIYTEGDHMALMSPEEQQLHVERVGGFIQEQMANGTIKSAQPLELTGTILSGDKGKFHDAPFNESKEVIGGYYHMQGESLDDIVALMKTDPRFEDGPWKIEIRPIRVVAGIN